MDEIKNRADRVQSGVEDAADEAGRTLRDAAGHASDRGHELAEDLAETARGARDRVAAGAREFRANASDVYDDARDWAEDSVDGHAGAPSAVEAFVKENPLLVGVVGLAAGLLIGALLPRTRGEDKAVGPWADEVRDQGYRYARDLTSRGREFVETNLDPDTLSAAAQRAVGAVEERAEDRPAGRA